LVEISPAIDPERGTPAEEPDVRGPPEPERRGQHADDFHRRTGERDRGADHVGTPAVAPFPQALAQDDAIPLTLVVVVRQERPAGDRARAEQREEIARDRVDGDLFGVASARQAHRGGADRGQALEAPAFAAEVHEIPRREASALRVGRARPHRDEAIRIGVRQRP
jgi:hypothetical protein